MKRQLEFAVEADDGQPEIGKHHGGSFRTYFSHKIAKLRDLHNNQDRETVSAIFADCVIFVNGITDPPVEEIRRLVILNGGKALAYRESTITHLVCDYLTDAQLKQELARTKMNTVHGRVYNVTAKWVTDSLRMNKRQAESLYLPLGLKSRDGANITKLFAKASDAVSSMDVPPSAKPVDGDTEVIELLDSSQESDTLASLTSSQRQFVSTLSSEIREEALAQILRHQAAAAAPKPSSCATTTSSKTELIELLTPCEEEPLPELLYNPEDLQLLIDSVYGDRFFASAPKESLAGLRSSSMRARRLAVALQECIGAAILQEGCHHRTRELPALLKAFGAWMIQNDDLESLAMLVTLLTNWRNTEAACALAEHVSDEAISEAVEAMSDCIVAIQGNTRRLFGCHLAASRA